MPPGIPGGGGKTPPWVIRSDPNRAGGQNKPEEKPGPENNWGRDGVDESGRRYTTADGGERVYLDKKGKPTSGGNTTMLNGGGGGIPPNPVFYDKPADVSFNAPQGGGQGSALPRPRNPDGSLKQPQGGGGFPPAPPIHGSIAAPQGGGNQGGVNRDAWMGDYQDAAATQGLNQDDMRQFRDWAKRKGGIAGSQDRSSLYQQMQRFKMERGDANFGYADQGTQERLRSAPRWGGAQQPQASRMQQGPEARTEQPMFGQEGYGAMIRQRRQQQGNPNSLAALRQRASAQPTMNQKAPGMRTARAGSGGLNRLSNAARGSNMMKKPMLTYG
tara:strand:+ start:231 stop:1217 length:987 start_codon:yes stop_codon:yes gene_type:complete